MSADGLGIGVAFKLKDAVGEFVSGVIGKDGAYFLKQRRASVVGVVCKVDGAAGGGFACCEDGFMHMMAVHALAAELGQQRRVDIQHTAGKVVRDDKQREEASEDQQVSVGFSADAEHGIGEGMLVEVGLAGHDMDVKATVLGAFNTLTVIVGCDDTGNLSVEGACLDAVIEVEQGCAPAGERDCEAGCA